MIRFEPVPEPPDFDERVRQRGKAWLAAHPTGRPRDYWREFTPQLRKGFRDLCAYSAMWIQTGDVDHFASCVERRERAYEWSNYRYADGSINSRKQGRSESELLDPFEVHDEWFEVLLPSLQLVVTDRCPPELQQRARSMIDKLGLGHSEWIVEIRRHWFEAWENKHVTLEWLDRKAPLLARAIRAREAAPAAKETST